MKRTAFLAAAAFLAISVQATHAIAATDSIQVSAVVLPSCEVRPDGGAVEVICNDDHFDGEERPTIPSAPQIETISTREAMIVTVNY